MKQFTDKVAAITGAGSGIGRALALQLADAGCHLALSDINAEALAETAEQATSRGVTVTTTTLDVADRDAVFAWAAAVVADHGRVNLLFNNAGVGLAGPAETAALADVEWLMNINFWGVVHGTQAFLPHLTASGEGHIINISSLFGLIGVPTQSAYCAAKFAVRGYTDSLRMELDLSDAPVSATCVHPGGVATNIARDSRVDPSIEAMTGHSVEDHTRYAEKTIQGTSPQQAASQILSAVRRDARRVLVGRDAQVIDKLARVMGAGYQRLVLRWFRRNDGAKTQTQTQEQTHVA